MIHKQFLQALIILSWLLSTTTLSTFSFFLGNYLPNPDYQLWISGTVLLNVACAVYWMCSHLKHQCGE